MSIRLTLEKCKKYNLYQILNVEADASIREIKQAYKKRALEVHPDKNPNDPDSSKVFKSVFEAFINLSDPNTRRLYDSKLNLEIKRQRKFEEEDSRLRQMKDILDRKEKEAESKFHFNSETDLAKKKIEKEIDRIRQKLKDKAFEQSNASRKPLVANKILKVEFIDRPENEKDLRIIFSHYGEIDKLIVKSKNAMISFTETHAVKNALNDPELEDFGLKVSTIKSKTERKRSELEAEYSHFFNVRPKRISFQGYESIVLGRLKQAASN